jgi:hypothetical protein
VTQGTPSDGKLEVGDVLIKCGGEETFHAKDAVGCSGECDGTAADTARTLERLGVLASKALTIHFVLERQRAPIVPGMVTSIANSLHG